MPLVKNTQSTTRPTGLNTNTGSAASAPARVGFAARGVKSDRIDREGQYTGTIDRLEVVTQDKSTSDGVDYKAPSGRLKVTVTGGEFDGIKQTVFFNFHPTGPNGEPFGTIADAFTEGQKTNFAISEDGLKRLLLGLGVQEDTLFPPADANGEFPAPDWETISSIIEGKSVRLVAKQGKNDYFNVNAYLLK